MCPYILFAQLFFRILDIAGMLLLSTIEIIYCFEHGSMKFDRTKYSD